MPCASTSAMAAARLLVTATRGMIVMERVHGDVAELEAVGEDVLRLRWRQGRRARP